jgi:solute carrier family 36 (proton-coupled amino acid transporter)
MLFSAVTLVLIALVSLFSFLLLVDTKMVVPGSFGGVLSVPLLGRQANTIPSDIGGAIYGKWMRRAILFSIIISQLGFVAAYTIFVAENLQVSRFSSAFCQMEFI